MTDPMSFVPLTEPPSGAVQSGPAMLFSAKGDAVHIGETDDAVDAETAVYLGRLGDTDCWAVDLDGDDEIDVVVTPLMALASTVSSTEWTIAGRAVQLLEWQRTNQFCGRCATPTEPVPGERARRCPQCRLLAFPRLAPAVITLVTNDRGEALLGRNANFPVPMFSCLAGFVEPGETLEQAVAREVLEEVGVVIKQPRYRASQPWPFPHSLMIGFSARWASGDIAPDGTEIAEAAWFSTDDLPMIPPRLSIARTLIDEWIAQN